MARPVTLFTGQWADLSCETMVQKAKEFGYDGLELACWGDHFEVDKADAAYCAAKRQLLESNGMKYFSISSHLVGQAVCDNIDERHKQILPDYIYGDGDPEGAVGPRPLRRPLSPHLLAPPGAGRSGLSSPMGGIARRRRSGGG